MGYEADLAFLFYNPTRVIFGAGSSGDAGVELQNLKCSRALIVTDKYLHEKTGVVKKVEKALGGACAGVFSDVPADSGVHVVDKGAAFGRERGADAIVSVGGGSAIDTAKGIAILLREGGSLLDYQGFQILTRDQTPHISIPTTAGTGSEVTYVAVIKDHEKKQKLLFGDHHIIPNVAILDPKLTLGLPPMLTAATGMDAFSHGLEAVTSAQREPIADALGLHAIRLIKEWLPKAVKNGADLTARGQMLIAATLGGAAFSNAQVGLIHAIAHVVGARHGVHHGTANAIAMPYAMKFNNDTVPDRYALVAHAMGVDVRGQSDEAAGLAAARAILAFNKEVGLPTTFKEVGVPESDLAACAEAAISDGAIVYNAKPVMDPREVLEVLKGAWGGVL
ncbi:MAG: iron-containing alcohol dehydrogenase [Deltaproteobacteria bacterium]|nr:iron-containing alcohol dehydrogenase [Deltaproteobacteria bacterium]